MDIDLGAYRIANPEEFGRNMLRLMEEGGKVMSGLLERADGKTEPDQRRQRHDRRHQAL